MFRIPAFTAFAAQPKIDGPLGFDEVGRAAMESLRESWQPMPTGNVREFAAFFSKRNYNYIKKAVLPLKPEEEAIFEAMTLSFQMIMPRADQMDERRENFSKKVIQSYVDEMNKYCIEKLEVDTTAAEAQANHYYRYMQGPWDIDVDLNLDTTTKHNCAAEMDFTWRMPH